MSTQPEALREATAKEASGEIPSYREAKLGPKFAQNVLDRQDLDGRIKLLEEQKDHLSKDILEMLAQTGLKAVQVEEYRPTIIDQDRPIIDKNTLVAELLARGMTATVIEAVLQKSTKVSHSTFLRVLDTDKVRTRGQEKRAGAVPIRKR